MDFPTKASSITLQLAIVDGIIKDILAQTKITPDHDEKAHHALNCRLGDCLAHRIALRDLVKQLNELTAIIEVTQHKVLDLCDILSDEDYSADVTQKVPVAVSVPVATPVTPYRFSCNKCHRTFTRPGGCAHDPNQVSVPPGVDPGDPAEDTDTDTTIPSDDDVNPIPDQDRKYRDNNPGPYGSRHFNFNSHTHPGKRTITDNDDDDDSTTTSVLEREAAIVRAHDQIFMKLKVHGGDEPVKKKPRAHKGKTTSPKYLHDRATAVAEATEFARCINLPEVYIDALTMTVNGIDA